LYELIEFTDERRHIDSFLSLSREIYAGDGNYRPKGAAETLSWLAGTHECAGFLRQRNLLVMRNGFPAARGIAFVNTIGNFGSVGFFECAEDAEAVKALMGGAKAFCEKHGVADIYAPMNGSIWSDYRLMTKGFGDRPFLGEPYNRPYYGDLLTECGFRPVKMWETQFAGKVKIRGDAARRYVREERIQRSKGIKIRSMRNFDADMRIIHKIAMNAFSRFFLFHRLGEEDFVNIYADLKAICDKRTVKIAFDPHRRPVGFGIALPDYSGKLGLALRYAKRYSLIYLGTLQENGESVYPQCGKAIIVSILRSLFIRRKRYIGAMMGEDAITRGFSKEYENIHEYALFRLEAD
jgi:hypothetical protein